jgi:hypothetical protein
MTKIPDKGGHAGQNGQVPNSKDLDRSGWGRKGERATIPARTKLKGDEAFEQRHHTGRLIRLKVRIINMG